MNIKTVQFNNDIEFFVSSLSETAEVEEFDSEIDAHTCSYASVDDDQNAICFHDVDGEYVSPGKWALIY